MPHKNFSQNDNWFRKEYVFFSNFYDRISIDSILILDEMKYGEKHCLVNSLHISIENLFH